METQKRVKRWYLIPQIIEIKLDNEISLALESTPPSGPYETLSRMETYGDDPYKNIT